MITDMTTSVPVINTAHPEKRNIHLIPWPLFWAEIIKTMKHLPKQNKTAVCLHNVKT